MKMINVNIPKTIMGIHKLFQNNDKKLYVVGGAVRDSLMNETPDDFDLATDATPDEIEKILSGYSLNAQGKKFGVIVVNHIDGLPEGLEIATFRKDQGVGKTTTVKIGVTIEDDVQRRDISFNGLFFDLDKGEVVDLVNGSDDLGNGVVRLIGNPNDRLTEDKLRILRVLRFASKYDFSIDKDTSDAIERDKKLTDISMERIWGEFNKSFKQSEEFKSHLLLLKKFGLFDEAFPGVEVEIEDYRETDDICIALAQIFKKCILNKQLSLKELKDIMIDEFKISNIVSNTVCFLLSLISFHIINVPILIKTRDRFKITDGVISEWFVVNEFNAHKYKILESFRPSIDAFDVMKKNDILVNGNGNPLNTQEGVKLGTAINQQIINLFFEELKIKK